MKITNGYQKLKGHITSFPTEEIIEPIRNYIDINSFYISSNFWYLKGILVKTQEREILAKNLQKKDP